MQLTRQTEMPGNSMLPYSTVTLKNYSYNGEKYTWNLIFYVRVIGDCTDMSLAYDTCYWMTISKDCSQSQI